MTKVEKKLLQWAEAHRDMLFIIIATVIGILLRWCGRNFESDDYLHCLLPWYEQLKAGGLPAIASGAMLTDYNVPYQVLIVILAHLPGSTLIKYKAVSWIFDALLVFGGASLAAELCGGRNTEKGRNAFALAWGCLAMWPSLFLNSAFWAQCDAIYVTFIVFSLLFHFREKPLPCFLFLAMAFAMKLQTVFIFPFFLYEYVIRKKYSLLWFLLLPALSMLICVLFRCGPLDFITIYSHQTTGQPGMTKEFPNLWMLIGVGDFFKIPGILMTGSALGIGLYLTMCKPKLMESSDSRMRIMLWTVWTCLFLMPHMHERYGYLLTVLLIIFTMLQPRFWILSLLLELVTLSSYQYFLFRVEDADYRTIAAITFTLMWCIMTWQTFLCNDRKVLPLKQ